MPNCKKFIFLTGAKVIFAAFCSFLAAVQIFANPGRLDFAFQSILADGANVTAIEIQTDGKILTAGKFNTRGAVLRRDVARLNSDGSLDTTFDFGSGTGDNGFIRFMKLQADGKIIVAGNFSRINGEFRPPIVRLNTNGSIDTTFNLSGINVSFVNDLDIQSDGKILISAMNAVGTSFVTRLNTDGSSDQVNNVPFFISPGNGNGYRVSFVPAENKILVGGNFTYTVNQTQYRNLARFNLDGTIDSTFTANVTNTTFDLMVNAKPLGSGKILVWGRFDTVNGVTRRNLAILNTDGSLDASFNPATIGTEIFISVAVQANGKIIVGGSNFTFNTFLRGNVARINADGTIDTTFNQGKGANDDVRAVKIRDENKLLIGGTFFRYNGVPRRGLAQIHL